MKALAMARAQRVFGEHAIPRAVQYHPVTHASEGIRCLCGAEIRGWVVDERQAHQREVSPGLHMRHERSILANRPNYQEIELTFADGSKHVTHGCRSCFQTADAERIERFYARDLHEFARLEEQSPAQAMPETLWALMAERAITGWRML